MDETVPSTNIQFSRKKGGNLFSQFVLIEIVFVLVIFLPVLGILNYFNIFSLSKLYPNQFGFLPHKPFLSKAPTAPSSNSYFSKQPNTDQKNAISDVLAASFIPNNLQLTKLNVKSSKNDNFYHALWQGENKESFTVLAAYNQKNLLVYRKISITIQNSFENLTPESVRNLAKTYLKVSPTTSSICEKLKPTPIPQSSASAVLKSSSQLTNCVSKWESAKVQKAIQVVKPDKTPSNIQLLYCEHYPGSYNYNAKDCLQGFSIN